MKIRKNFIFWLSALVIACATLLQIGSSASEQVDTAAVEVDFGAKIENVKSASGFLHSFATNKPTESLIRDLKPKQWRVGELDEAKLKRIGDSGARAQIVLSDLWGYPGLTSTGKWAFEDFTAYENFVRRTARANRSKNLLWDVWNEPEDSRLPFWKGSFDQFCETYLRAYKVLRDELGADAMIGGPSFSKYDQAELKRFLDYCLENGCEVNFLSWHELDDRKITSIGRHLREAREMFVENPAYARLNIKEIQINEIVGSRAQNSPGAILGYFYYLEQGNADGASKACWENAAGDYNCYNDTLDGLLNPANFQPTAAWWAYKFYADGTPSRVVSVSDNPRIVSLASSQSSQEKVAQILLGYFRQSASDPLTANVLLNLKNLNSANFTDGKAEIKIRIEKIPAMGERVLLKPELTEERNFKISESAVNLNLKISVNEAFLVTIE